MISAALTIIALGAGALMLVVHHFRLDQLERRLDHFEETRRFYRD